MSLRPPSHFIGGTDLILWLKHFEMYVRKVKLDESQWKSKLLPLLDDGPFMVVSLVDSGDYVAGTRCLRAQYAPEQEANHLEWQAKFQRRGRVVRQGIPWMVEQPTATIGKGLVCAWVALCHCVAESHERNARYTG